MAKTHRLARRRNVRVRDLRDERILWGPREENPLLEDALIVKLREHGVSTPAVHQRDGEAVLALTAAGFGVSLIVESFSFAVHDRIVLRPVVDAGIDIDTHLIWRADDAASPFVRTLLAVTRAL